MDDKHKHPSLPKAENKWLSNGSIIRIRNEEINEEGRWKTLS